MLFNDSTVFEYNYAGLEGGAVHLATPANKISSAGSNFIGNTATVNGGAVHSYQGDWTSTGDRFEENSAVSGSGGALSMTASHLNFDATTTCQNNRANNGGGGCLLWESEAKNIEDVKWKLFKPTINNMQLIGNNNALFGPSLATPGVSLRIVNLTNVTTNDEKILFPYPRC